ncbi:Neurotransmitter-gated ion-channel transmembrane domain [Trinorchestia longiramus]|nr:Neurotransmitter-gated ion-channel transmembrane domain [Trinorchestia longiramus]
MCHFFSFLLFFHEGRTNTKFKHPKFTHNVPEKPGFDFINPVEDLSTLIASHRRGSDFNLDHNQKEASSNDRGFFKSEFETRNIHKKAMESMGKQKSSENLTRRLKLTNGSEKSTSPVSFSVTDLTNVEKLNASEKSQNTTWGTVELQNQLKNDKNVTRQPSSSSNVRFESSSSKRINSDGILFPESPTDHKSENVKKSSSNAEKFRTSMMEETKPHIIELDVDAHFDELSKYNKTNLKYSLTSGISEVIVENEYDTTEHRLFSRLFAQYNKHIRPTIYGGEVTFVLFKLSLQDIMEMNTRSRMLRINTEMIMLWEDVHLSWDPMEYDNVTAIRVPHYQIWVPDIILFNTAEPDYESSILNTNAIIFHDGQIELLSHALFSSICDVNVEFYPFDEQICSLRFSSWTYENTEIVISSAKADISHFTPNPEFYLENFYVTVSEEFNECCKLPFSTMTYVVQMQRQSKFALFFFVMPGILINICALLVFSLPVETGEKVGLGVNSMLAMIVFLIAVTEDMPPTEHLPLAGLYYGVCLSLITSNIAFSVYVLNLNYTGMRGFKVPHLMRRASLLLARVLKVPVPREVLVTWQMDKMGKTLGQTKVEPEEFNVEKTQLPDYVQELFSKTQDHVQDAPLKDSYERRHCRAVEKLASLFDKQHSTRLKNEKKDGIKGEWKFVSRALDRLLVIVFTLTAFFFNVYLLAASPYGYKFMYCPLEEGCGDMSETEIKDLITQISYNTLSDKSDAHEGGH